MPPPSIAVIAATARNLLRVSEEDYYGGTRHPITVAARMLTVVVARRTTLLSFPDLGEAMGMTSHSTQATQQIRFDQLQHLDLAAYVKRGRRHWGPVALAIPPGLESLTLAQLAAHIEAEVVA
jgi:hypothetical protein